MMAMPGKSAVRLAGAIAVVAAAFLQSVALGRTFEETQIAASYLKISSAARASAMGEAFSAVADDASALYWNPAGLGGVHEVSLMVSHNQWLGDVRIENFYLAIPASGTWGIGYSILDLGEFAEWEGPGYQKGNVFSVNGQVVSAGYGRSFFADALQVGASARAVRENLGGGVSGQAFNTDLGVLAVPWWITPGLQFAAVVQNLGGGIAGYETPFGGRFGVSYRHPGVVFQPSLAVRGEPGSGEGVVREAYPWEEDGNNGDLLVASGEVVIPKLGRTEFHWGVEYWLSFVAVRAGYRFRFPRNDLGGISGLTLGLGIRGRSLQFDYGFDYAYAPYGELGDASRFSLQIGF